VLWPWFFFGQSFGIFGYLGIFGRSSSNNSASKNVSIHLHYFQLSGQSRSRGLLNDQYGAARTTGKTSRIGKVGETSMTGSLSTPSRSIFAGHSPA
jgi:hypothetical protein